MNVVEQRVNQDDLTSECWLVQFYGVKYCKTRCSLYKTDDCGGKPIIQTGKNRKGLEVPLGYEDQKFTGKRRADFGLKW